nr:hypothetical protein [uncultured Ottowia sp.]
MAKRKKAGAGRPAARALWRTPWRTLPLFNQKKEQIYRLKNSSCADFTRTSRYGYRSGFQALPPGLYPPDGLKTPEHKYSQTIDSFERVCSSHRRKKAFLATFPALQKSGLKGSKSSQQVVF